MMQRPKAAPRSLIARQNSAVKYSPAIHLSALANFLTRKTRDRLVPAIAEYAHELIIAG